MNEKLLNLVINEVSTPLFVYDYDIIKHQYIKLSNALPSNSKIYYSVKANPSLAICQVIKTLTDYAEVSSLSELLCVLKCGFQNENILFSGPGKMPDELEYAIKHNVTLNVESLGETLCINKICSMLGKKANVMIRLNPNFSNRQYGITMTGVSSQFGVDIADFDHLFRIIKEEKWISIEGFSVYLGSQIMDANVIVDNTKKILELYVKLMTDYQIEVKKMNFGGGFGVSYYDDRELECSKLEIGLNELFEKYHSILYGVDIIFESGRYLLSEAGAFVTKVLYKKKSKDKEYLICDGGLNNILISAFYTRELRGNFPIDVCTSREKFERIEYTVCGPLCTPNDKFGCNVLLPTVNEGDRLIIKKVGAYGYTYSPVFFISHRQPPEILFINDHYYIIRSSTTDSDYFYKQNLLPEKTLSGGKNL